ncbi:MAG: hypothetical protein H0W85_05425 [Methylotenera sp.]|nr:hypothetical protein [Methylotenera sp.]
MSSFFKAILLALSAAIALAACSSINIPNPFSSGTKELSGAPVNATEYICEGNKHFYVRILNNGSDAWLIYPDHEVNLVKSAGNGNLYTSGAISLDLRGDSTTLNDGEKIANAACKPQVKK